MRRMVGSKTEICLSFLVREKSRTKAANERDRVDLEKIR